MILCTSMLRADSEMKDHPNFPHRGCVSYGWAQLDYLTN